MKTNSLIIYGLAIMVMVTALADDKESNYRNHPFFLFDSEQSYTADIALVDADGDGDLDALTANGRHWAQQDFVFLNSGSGRMLEAARVGSRLGPSYKLCPGDFDQDGDVDLVVIRDLLPAQLFLNDGEANFTYASDLAGSGGAARSAVAVDINSDKALDIVVALRRGADRIYYGDGEGNFEPGVNLPGDGKGSTGIASGDLDSDGDIDLVVARRDQSDSVIFYNKGMGLFAETPLKGSQGDHRKVVVADFNQDGRIDIVLVSTGGQHKLYAGTVDGAFPTFSTFGSEGRSPQAMAVADLDGDGDMDLVEGADGPNTLYENLGNGAFKPLEIPDDSDTYGVAIGDLNGDLKPDLVFANSESMNQVLLAR